MSKSPQIEMIEESDPAELEKARKMHEQFDRNSAWLQTHVSEAYSQHRGKVICIAGEELFVGETTKEAVSKARAKHPDDKGYFTRYIPREKVVRVYAI